MNNSPTLEPVTVGGYYEHQDGTVGRYVWSSGTLCLIATYPNWPAVKAIKNEWES